MAAVAGFCSLQHGLWLGHTFLCQRGPAVPPPQREMHYCHAKKAFPMLRGISGCPFWGVFWLVFSEGLQSSWKSLCLKLQIRETLFISIWLNFVYDLCNVLPCGSLGFGMWTCPLFPGRKQLLPTQCREVALACSEGNLINFFSREKTWLIMQ